MQEQAPVFAKALTFDESIPPIFKRPKRLEFWKDSEVPLRQNFYDDKDHNIDWTQKTKQHSDNEDHQKVKADHKSPCRDMQSYLNFEMSFHHGKGVLYLACLMFIILSIRIRQHSVACEKKPGPFCVSLAHEVVEYKLVVTEPQ